MEQPCNQDRYKLTGKATAIEIHELYNIKVVASKGSRWDMDDTIGNV